MKLFEMLNENTNIVINVSFNKGKNGIWGINEIIKERFQ